MSDFITRKRRNGDQRHGTLAAALRHSRNGEDPCDACRAAKSEYDRRWRAAPARTRDNRVRAAAQRKALKALKAAHETEYRSLYVRFRDELLKEAEAQREDGAS